MADYHTPPHQPHPPQQPGATPQQAHDPAGSTQMFRAFVDEVEPDPRPAAGAATVYGSSSRGSRTGLIVGIVVAVLVVAVVAILALG